MDDFEKNWQRIQDALGREYAGDVQPRVSSTRTLFGIKSEAEQKMEQLAREIDQQNIRKLKERQEPQDCQEFQTPSAEQHSESKEQQGDVSSSNS